MKLALGTLICVTGLAAAGFAVPARAEPVEAPHNVTVEPSSPQSSQAATKAATADMKGDAQGAVKFADQGIAADPSDPWPYYNKAEALARMGQTDAAVATFAQAEQRFAETDRWGKSVAIFGRAHALAAAGRCKEARVAFTDYATLMHGDPNAAKVARRYADDCDAANRAAQP
jgi:tetratricopeptide (TPR) repeat protein